MKDIKYWVESSYDFEDKEKEFPECLIVGSDLGDEVGTESIGSFPLAVKSHLEDLIRTINEQIESS